MSTCNLPTCNAFSSRHFHLQQRAEGVYTAINAEEGWAIIHYGLKGLIHILLPYIM